MAYAYDGLLHTYALTNTTQGSYTATLIAPRTLDIAMIKLTNLQNEGKPCCFNTNRVYMD